jgi:recombination protein RecT
MNNEVTKQQSSGIDLRTFISGDAVKQQITKALPSICTPDRFLRVAMTSITKSPKLLQCDRDSFVSALLDCAQLGIEPDGRRAHLIPYGKTCQLIIDYKGIVELVMRSGKISLIHADKVCENDVFEYNAGKIVNHKIDFKKPRGKIYAYYAYAEMKDGSTKAEVMTLEDIEKIKNRSRSSNNGPWKTDPEEMSKKTVFRRLSKWLPLSPEDAQVLKTVEDKEFDFEMPTTEPQKVQITAEKAAAALIGSENAEALDEKWRLLAQQAPELTKDSIVTDAYKARKAELSETV